MNVSLIFHQTGYNFQISQFTPLSFIYEVAHKVFHIPADNIKLFFKEQYIPNEQTYASIYFKKFPVIINVLEAKITEQSNPDEKAKITEEKIYIETIAEKIKQKKKNFIKCQICTKKNSIFYCRNCNQFICFECNLRYPEHFSHKKISLESGDLLLCFEEYRNSVLEQLNEINNAYRFSSENIYSDQKRAELFDSLMNTLKDLDKKTQSLTIMGTSYKCNNKLLNNFNKELREIEPPKYKEETINSFGLVNEKELEIKNYISFINLQILKSKFNKKMTIFFNETKKIFNELMLEINNKLHESLYLKEKDYNDLVLYNKEQYKKKDSSSSRTNTYSSSSKSLNKSLSLNSSITKNNEDNKLSDKYSSSNNLNNKIDVNAIINRTKKNNCKVFNLYNRNRNQNSFSNLMNIKNNHTEGNLKKINSGSIIVKEDDYENNEGNDDENLLTLPKIKIVNDSNNDIKINREKIFSPINKVKNSIFNLKKMNNAQQSYKNILLKSQSQSRNLKQLTNNLNNLKLYDIEHSKNIKTIQLNNNNNNNNELKKSFSNLKIKSINNKNDKDNEKKNDENNNLCETLNNNISTNPPENETNKILNGLKKIKANHKIKLYDTYKFKDNKEYNDNNDLDNIDYNSVFKKSMKKSFKDMKKKRIYQKEK